MLTMRNRLTFISWEKQYSGLETTAEKIVPSFGRWGVGVGEQHTLKRDRCDPWPPQQRPQGGGGGGEEDDMNEKQTGFSI